MRASWVFLAALGCSTAPPTDDDTDDTDVGDTDTGAETDVVDTDCSDDVPTGTGIHGTVKTTSGAPLGPDDVRVQFCRGVTCLFPVCHWEGAFAFGELTPGAGSFAIAPIDGGRFETFVPITLVDGVVRELDVAVPDLTAGVAIPAERAEIEPTDGLYLTVGAGDLPGQPPLQPAPTEIAALAVDMGGEGVPPLEGFTGTAVGLFWLDPFDSAAADDLTLPVRFDDPGWAAGARRLWVADYFTAQWVDLGPLTADEGGKLAPSEGGLPRLSTLLVTVDPVEMAAP